MRKLLLAAGLIAALVLPAAPASADKPVAWFGQKRCPAPYVGGTIIWHDTPATPYEEIWLCIPGTPGMAASDADGSARAGVGICQNWHPGYRGVYVWWYDLDNNYHRTNTCIYIGP